MDDNEHVKKVNINASTATPVENAASHHAGHLCLVDQRATRVGICTYSRCLTRHNQQKKYM